MILAPKKIALKTPLWPEGWEAQIHYLTHENILGCNIGIEGFQNLVTFKRPKLPGF